MRVEQGKRKVGLVGGQRRHQVLGGLGGQHGERGLDGELTQQRQAALLQDRSGSLQRRDKNAADLPGFVIDGTMGESEVGFFYKPLPVGQY